MRKVLLILSILLFLAFILFSYLVAKERFVQFDFDSTVKVQDHISPEWNLPFSFLSLLGTAEITGLIWLLILFITLLKKYWLTFISLFSLVLATIIEIFGKIFLYHPGPPFLFFRGESIIEFPTHYVQTAYSYPSGHVTRTSFLIIFLVAWLYLKVPGIKSLIIQVLLVTFLGLMVISRIYLGEHWTTDVIGGFLIGSSFGLFSAVTIPQKKHKEKNISTIDV